MATVIAKKSKGIVELLQKSKFKGNNMLNIDWCILYNNKMRDRRI